LGYSGICNLCSGGVYTSRESANANAFTVCHPGKPVGNGHCVTVIPHHQKLQAFSPKRVVDTANREGRYPWDVFLLENPCYAGCYIDGQIVTCGFRYFVPGLLRDPDSSIQGQSFGQANICLPLTPYYDAGSR
jgi:hypothetical protein